MATHSSLSSSVYLTSATIGAEVRHYYTSLQPQESKVYRLICKLCRHVAAFCILRQRNGVVGLKPTVGLTSRAGTIPLNPEQDSIGPSTRWVKDSAIIIQVIAGNISVPLGFYSEARPVLRNGKGQLTKAPNIPSVALDPTRKSKRPPTVSCSFAITSAGRRFSEEKLISCAYSFRTGDKGSRTEFG